jgi:hypothetical protein
MATITERLAELDQLAQQTGQPRTSILAQKIGKFSSGEWGGLHEGEIVSLRYAAQNADNAARDAAEPYTPDPSNPAAAHRAEQRAKAAEAEQERARIAAASAALAAEHAERATEQRARDRAEYQAIRKDNPFAAASYAAAHPHIYEEAK